MSTFNMLKFGKGVIIMKKNVMRTPKEKEKIIKEYYENNLGYCAICKKYNISSSVLWRWLNKYENGGINSLKSNTGKQGNGLYLRKPKNKIEELELELMKKEIEIARLKKGYMVKGVGVEKEFVTTLDKNTK